MSIRKFVLICGAVFALSGALGAQGKPLKVTIRREWEGARTSAPLSLRVFLKWQKPELLQGRLQVNAFIDQLPINRWTSNDTALSDSEQVLWFMSPRPVMVEQYERYVLQAQFLGEAHHFETEQLDVEVPVRRRRVMVIGIVLAQGTSTPIGLGAPGAPTAFEQPFLLQQKLTSEEGFALHVHPSRLTPEEFPADPLRLLGLDAVLLSHDTFNQFRPAQIRALQTWVLAGGTLTLVQTGRLEPAAHEFVQQLARNEWSQATELARGLPPQTTVYAPGLGQFILVSREVAGDSLEWGRIARLMLRIQPQPARRLEGMQKLPLEAIAGPQLLEPLPRFSATALTNLLMPESIRGMPFGLAASVLACCLFCIAPVDYFLLGLLKRRKWTWGLFPLVALGFTGFMAHLAAEHNGRNDSRTWISIVDVTPENEVLRTSRFELTYGASGRTVAHPVQNQWWVDVRQEDFAKVARSTDDMEDFDAWASQQRSSGPSTQPTALDERLSFHGSVPVNYIVEEPVRQWSPRMQRITTLGADPALANYPLPQIPWDAVWAAAPQSMAETVSQSVEKVWPNARWMSGGPGFQSGWENSRPDAPANERLSAVLQIASGMCHPQTSLPPGLFSLVTELSPTAGPDGEDLVIATRPTCLIVNEVEPGRYLVLRVVFPHESPVDQIR